MLVIRAVTVGFTLVTVAKAMSSLAATPSCELRGLRGSAAGSPGRRKLQKLLGVPGCAPNRANDLLLLQRPDEDDTNKHVVFFHGDIQVRPVTRPGFLSHWGSYSYGGPGGTFLFSIFRHPSALVVLKSCNPTKLAENLR